MDTVLTHRGRAVTAADVAAIRRLIADHPRASRRQLSERLCQRWDWRQANGALCAMRCRGLMLALHRAGHIALPPVRVQPPNNVVLRRQPPAVAVDRTPVRCRLAALTARAPVIIEQVRGDARASLVDSLIAAHHYLGYTRGVGEQLKYLVTHDDRVLACLSFTSAVRHLAPRDRFIGWSATARRNNLHYLGYNTRFLILPWVEVPHLASHLLAAVARRIAGDWQRRHGHPVYYLETFVAPQRYRGTCYRAANWRLLGLTTGRGKNAPSMRPTRSVKQVWGYPLTRRFRSLLTTVAP